MKILRVLSIALVAAATMPAHSHGAASASPVKTSAIACSPQQSELRVKMRELWQDHVSYTRGVVTSLISELPDAQIVTQRLLRNQADIGNAIKPFYGTDAGDALAALLRDHIIIAARVVAAAKAGRDEELAAARQTWDSNATELAKLLAAANPNWKQTSLQTMLELHLDFLTRQVDARLRQDWAADIKAYDEGFAHMMMLADLLSDGLARQFPDGPGNTK